MMRRLVEELTAIGILRNPPIAAAFSHTDRADFVPDSERESAYINTPLPIGYGQTISQPFTVAFMLELLQPRTGDIILDIGAGSGWQTALLSYIVSHNAKGEEVHGDEAGKVYALELIPELAQFAYGNISRYSYTSKKITEVHCLNAEHGYAPGAPYDKIIAAAAGRAVPEAWREQLNPGGIIVTPLKSRIVKVTKEADGTFTEEAHEGFAFVPFISGDE